MKIQNSLKIVVILSTVFLFSCGNRKALVVENIDYLYVDYDIYAQNNLGTPFSGTISAQMKSGESITLSNNKGFSSSENLDARIKDNKISVYYTLPNYKTNKVPVQLTYTDKSDATVNSVDSVVLNFTGNTQAWYNGVQGSSGQTGTSGKTPILFRDGSDGIQGGPGQEGSNGNNLEIYVWKGSDTLYFYVLNTSLNHGERYLVIGSESLFYIDATGGAGGQGGTGGQGGDGKNGEVSTSGNKLPGRGGHGGSGGFGGRGGNGGNVTVNFHPTAAGSEARVVIYNSGGSGGYGGTGGKGGSAGKIAAGQVGSKPGLDGVNAPNGSNGIDGQLYVISKEFEYNPYK